MTIYDFDPEILQDFITESGELLEQLEGDLVVLESTPQDPELLNQIFRALHTIKGSASFLALNNLVSIAHVAESALNAARNGQVIIGSLEMDLLLGAVDILKIQFDEIIAGNMDLTAAEPGLIDSLSQIGNGTTPNSSAPDNPTSETIEAESDQPQDAQHADGRTVVNLALDSSKLDLIDALTSDIEDTIAESMVKIDQLRDSATRVAAGNALTDLFDELCKTIDFFDIPEMIVIAKELETSIESFDSLSNEQIIQVIPRLQGLCLLFAEQTAQLENQVSVSWDMETLLQRLRNSIEGGATTDGALDADADGYIALHIDGIPFGDETLSPAPTNLSDSTDEGANAKQTTTNPQAPEKRSAIGTIEQTIRVEVGRLESLMNLVGELVLQKNRIGALAEGIEKTNASDEFIEQMESTAGILDRVTGDIQLAVMRTRMQPLDKLFGKYPRLIRDLAGKTEKKINLVIEGGDTEVDKSVIEELGDPLVHLLRNSGDHGIESPEARIAAGKDEIGTIRLIAGHAGSHVCVQIIDDGKGLNEELIGSKAVEKGLVTQEKLNSMSSEEVFRFILEPGFSTAEVVSDLSGRGVGMDVVRTNIESKLKGELTIESKPGVGTTLTITIPLTVAIMPAMMVAVANEVYAIPLTNITEIVHPSRNQLSEIGNDPVIHLRGQVHPLISAQKIFDVSHENQDDEEFVVVISYNQRLIGLKVSSVIGQQEIVIKPLDGVQREGPISGATIRNDGSVSLIMDIAKLVQSVKAQAISHIPQEPVAMSGR